MLSSAIGALTDRLDSKFLTAYWLPAFVAFLGGIGILGALVGPPQLEAWAADLDSVEQSIGALIVLLLITMLAFILRALTWPIAALFAGDALPQAVAQWSTRGQLTAKARATQALAAASDSAEFAASKRQMMQRLKQIFPRDDADVMATLFGNVLAAAAEHPRFVYAMDGALWWPRLTPLLPGAFQDMLSGTQAPLMGLLNLSAVFTVLALGGATVLALAGSLWAAAGIVLAGGLILSRLCYRAAIGQAAELGNLLAVAFDLYRHEILRQLEVATPGDLPAERALWIQLTAQMQALPAPTLAGHAAQSPPGSAAQMGGAQPYPS